MALGKFHKYDGQIKHFIRSPKLEQIEHIFFPFSFNVTFLYFFYFLSLSNITSVLSVLLDKYQIG
nr:MAG TPA: hypothetical protein [Caudoviricetes sp.]